MRTLTAAMLAGWVALGANAQATWEKLEIPGCENAFRVSDRMYSGGEPHGDEAFKALAELGVKTILTVDGAKPDAETAARHGIRYVHLPIGYDGIKRARELEIGRAVAELPTPMYVHCHHGKHRGPTAVAIGMLVTEGWTPEKAKAFLEAAGTSPSYDGLYQCVADFTMPTPAEMDAVDTTFPPAAEVSDVAEVMVHIDHAFDNLLGSQKVNWAPSPEHPDVTASHEALQLYEAFHELGRSVALKDKPEEFRTLLTEADGIAKRLHTALESGKHTEADAAVKELQTNCSSCHKKYRN